VQLQFATKFHLWCLYELNAHLYMGTSHNTPDVRRWLEAGKISSLSPGAEAALQKEDPALLADCRQGLVTPNEAYRNFEKELSQPQ
jgi:hypothetical protein